MTICFPPLAPPAPPAPPVLPAPPPPLQPARARDTPTTVMDQDLLMESTGPIETGAYARRRVRVNRRPAIAPGGAQVRPAARVKDA